jgi:gamma-D-glutamyl-L-lysine dipeptidyl-peptidase
MSKHSSFPSASLGLPLLLALLCLLGGGCAAWLPSRASLTPTPTGPSPAANDPIAALLPAAGGSVAEAPPLAAMGYSVQVGAFVNLDNAVRLERLLDARGIDAYYFRHESGLYKVRFGNHASYQQARAEAEQLQRQGLIGTFFIVIPEDYPAARLAGRDHGALRAELVKTARRFIGVPYRWGGTDVEEGFDCSGLTLVCYRLNGLNLPRVSRSQYQAGRRVARDQLQPGDLVFFATKGGSRVTHVGLYIGNGKFIHAPRTGKTVRIANLSTPFFTRTFVGGRSYL